MFTKLLTILIAITLISACGTTRLSQYDYAGVDAGQKSIVRTDNTPLLPALLSLGILSMPSTTLLAVDGQVIQRGLFALDDQVAVAIGRREFDVSCPSDRDYNRGISAESVIVEIKSNQEYIISCRPKTGIAVKFRDFK